MKRTPKPFIWLALAGLALLGGGGLCVMQYMALGERVAEYEKAKRLVENPKSVENELDKTRSDLADAQSRLMHLERSVPPVAYVPTLLKELEAFGIQHGIKVTGVRPLPTPAQPKDQGKTVKRKAYEELMIEVKGRGEFWNVLSFVKGLQTFPKVVAARAVSLAPKNDPTLPVSSLDVTIELKSYLFAQAAPEPESASAKTLQISTTPEAAAAAPPDMPSRGKGGN